MALTGLAGLPGLSSLTGGTPLEAPDVVTELPLGAPGGQVPTAHARDATNGFDLYDLGADTPSEYPASCTKLMTALLAHEYHSGDWGSGTVTLTSGDVTQPIAGLTMDSAGFQSGDVVTWEGLATALFHVSSFEACQAMARVIGDEIYAAAGGTGSQGRARFVERMNERASELGLSSAVYFDSFGGSKTTGPDVVRNVISARDLSEVCRAAMARGPLRDVAAAQTGSVSVTGGRTATIATTNFNRFVNGPTPAQAGGRDPNALGGKFGAWAVTGVNQWNLSQVWATPAGYEVVITTLGSQSLQACMLDQRGIYFSLLRDFPYLLGPAAAGADADFASVQLLVGADGSVADESAAARSLTATSVGSGAGVVAGSTGSALFNAGTDSLAAADAAALNVGSGDATVEVWYAGNGATPSAEYVFFSKADSGQNEWAVNEFNGVLSLFASPDGSNWQSATALSLAASLGARATFHNGAPRHLALVKSGGSWRLYVDGERVGDALAVTPFNGTAPLRLGISGGISALGSFDEFRVTVGVARYAGAMFAPPARKFPRSA